MSDLGPEPEPEPAGAGAAPVDADGAESMRDDEVAGVPVEIEPAQEDAAGAAAEVQAAQRGEPNHSETPAADTVAQQARSTGSLRRGLSLHKLPLGVNLNLGDGDDPERKTMDHTSSRPKRDAGAPSRGRVCH
jgi:hypothetical protein